MRRPSLFSAVLVVLALVPLVLFAADVFEQYGLERAPWENSLLNVSRGSFSPPQIGASLRELDGPARAAAVQALGGFAREYTKSEDFKKRYSKAYKEWNKSQGGGGGFGLGSLTKKVSDDLEKKATDAALGKDEAEDRYAMDKDPNVTLKKRLDYFLKVSKDVDFNAKLSGRQFADPEFEKKPAEWKMCYRAGREATEAARQVATDWRAELEAAGAKK